MSIQFGALEYAKRFFASQNAARGQAEPGKLQRSQLFSAGVFAGLANSVVSGPVEHIRIRMLHLCRAQSKPLTTFVEWFDRSADTVQHEPGLLRTLGRRQEDLYATWYRRDLQRPGRDSLP